MDYILIELIKNIRYINFTYLFKLCYDREQINDETINIEK